MVPWAADIADWCRRALALARLRMSAGIAGALLIDHGLQGRDDALQVGLDLAEVVDQAELAPGIGLGDEAPVGGGLAAVGVQELGCGLEVWARKTSVGVRAFLLGGAGAIAVGQAVAHPVQVLLHPLGTGCGAVGVVADSLAGDVDPLGLVAVEGLPHGAVVDFGIMPGHIGAGVAEQFLHDVLGDA